jgi:uncharacterized membrane protein YkoI
MSSRNARALGHAIALALAMGVSSASRADAQRPPATTKAGAPTKATKTASGTATKPAPAISKDSARALVLASRRGATVVSQRLMRKDGRQVYSFRVRAKGKPVTERVLVDANTGEVQR